jgi:hypothetical protein
MPQVVRYPEDEVPAGYPAYFSADIAGNRELLLAVAEALEFDQTVVIERTTRIAGALDPGPGQSQFAAVAFGNFPQGLVEFSLSLNGELENRDSLAVVSEGRRQSVFEQQDGRLSLTLPRDDALYLSNTDVDALLDAPARGREAIRRDTYSALIGVGGFDGPEAIIVFEDPGAGLLSGLGIGSPSVPLTSVSLALRVEQESLFLDGMFTTRTPQEAAIFSRIGRLFVIVFVRSLGLDATAAREQAEIFNDGTRVYFDGIPMTEDELVAVIQRFVRTE